MAVPTGTFQTYAAVGIREDLEDVIYNISPTETPFINSIGKGKATATYHEWQKDTLANPNVNNARVEGDDSTGESATPTVRYGNYTQISDKVPIVSDTLEAVDKAGRKGQMAYELAKRGKELKRDIEAICVSNQAPNAGSASTARQARAFEMWMFTNANRGTGGQSPSWPSGSLVDGTQRAFTETIFLDVLGQIWNRGGDPKMMLVGRHNKRVASGFTGGRTIMEAGEKKKVVGTVDFYESDFGVTQIIATRFMGSNQARARTAFIYDPEYWAMAYLQPFQTKPLADTGHSIKRLLWCEWTLVCKNEEASGVAADLTTS